MPNLTTPGYSVVTGYVPDELKERGLRVVKTLSRYSMSRIVEECLEAHLPALEKRAGIRNGAKRKQVA